MAAFYHLARRSVAPAAAACLIGSASRTIDRRRNKNDAQYRAALCDAAPRLQQQQPLRRDDDDEQANKPAPATTTVAGGMAGGGNDQDYFHGLFPKRQLWQPRLAYPLWDYDWDGRREPPTGNDEADRERERELRRKGVTRHIILIRHGQYDETHQEDEKRVLTALGRAQADLTGKRLAEMVKGVDEKFGPCNVRVLRVSGMKRAQETAEIIAKHLPEIDRADPDPLLNEGRPAHHIPGGKARAKIVERTDEQHPRIEKAFRKYFYRADKPDDADDPPADGEEPPKHEFEIIVCHANVIRYFLCRSLQLPPEVWLRLCTFNCSLTYLTIRPTGTVSCRMLGDIGHLGLDHSTFSMHHGFNW